VGAWLSSLILARQAGLKVGFPREYTEWQGIPMILLPSPLTSTSDNLVHVYTDFWKKAEYYVQQGGSLYASLCADVAIPEMEYLFGARLVDHTPVEAVSLKVVAEFGDLQPGDMFHYQGDSSNPRHWAVTLDIRGGQVIAIDQNDEPALVAHQNGNGKTLLCAYPLESYLALTPAAFEGQENTHRIYRAFSQWAGVKSLFSTDQPMVEVAALADTKRGYAILANHNLKALNVSVSSTLSLMKIRQVAPSGFQDLNLNHQGWNMKLDGFSGAVVEWFI
jgi:hypothetical protein